MFQKIIEKIINNDYNISYSPKEIKTLNIIIYSITNRILYVLVKIVQNCNKKIIRQSYIDIAMQIEFNQVIYDINKILVNKDISHLIRNIYFQNIASIFPITKDTVNLLSKIIIFFINLFINNSLTNDNSLNFKYMLLFFEKINKPLSSFVINKYKIN